MNRPTEFEDIIIETKTGAFMKKLMILSCIVFTAGAVYAGFVLLPKDVQAETYTALELENDPQIDMDIGECLITSLIETGSQNLDCYRLGDYTPPLEN